MRLRTELRPRSYRGSRRNGSCYRSPAAEEKSADDLVYAVEAGSAGEAVALENGWNVVSVDTQSKALMEVAAGTSDAAIIDLLMAGAMIGEGTSYPDMKLGDELTTEEYGVGCRKGSDLADFINSVFAEAYADGTMLEIAKTYGVQESLVEQPAAEEVSATLMTATLPTSRTTRAPSSSASPISSRWTTRMRMANGSALTLTWQTGR